MRNLKDKKGNFLIKRQCVIFILSFRFFPEISIKTFRLSIKYSRQPGWQQVSRSERERLMVVTDASPELLYWFSEQTLQPGPAVSLKCVATGNPPPQFVWTLDGFPVPDNNRWVLILLFCHHQFSPSLQKRLSQTVKSICILIIIIKKWSILWRCTSK